MVVLFYTHYMVKKYIPVTINMSPDLEKTLKLACGRGVVRAAACQCFGLSWVVFCIHLEFLVDVITRKQM